MYHPLNKSLLLYCHWVLYYHSLPPFAAWFEYSFYCTPASISTRCNSVMYLCRLESLGIRSSSLSFVMPSLWDDNSHPRCSILSLGEIYGLSARIKTRNVSPNCARDALRVITWAKRFATKQCGLYYIVASLGDSIE